MVASIIAWLALAYVLVPKFWQHSSRAEAEIQTLVTRTKQGLPGDPINVAIHGSQADLACMFDHIGWQTPQRVSFRSAAKISASVIVRHPYLTAPVSTLYYEGRPQDAAFESEVGRSANRRHHVRFWQVGLNDWLGAATFDIGSGLNKYTGQVTHHISAAVDQERDTLVAQLQRQGAIAAPDRLSGLPPKTIMRNGGGDKYITDGKIKSLTLNRPCHRATSGTMAVVQL